MIIKTISGVIVGGIIVSIIGINTYEEGTKPIEYVNEAHAEEPEPKEIKIEVQPAALNEIADCESGVRNADGTAVEGSARHYDENGTVITNTNSEVGIDVGWCQINTHYHLERSQELGLNIFEENENKAYCRLLYKEQGAEPWEASKGCWN